MIAPDPKIERALRTGMREFKKCQAMLTSLGFKKTVKQGIPADKYVFVFGQYWVVVSFASGRWIAFEGITDSTGTGAVKRANGMTHKELSKWKWDA